MDVSHEDFKGISQSLIPECINLVKNLDGRLADILRLELLNGNKIGYVSGGWPSKNGIIVEMVGRMNLKHDLPDGVYYNHINDPHYWMHEYTTFNGSNLDKYDLIVCGNREIQTSIA